MTLGEAFQVIYRGLDTRELWRRGLAFFLFLVGVWIIDPIGVATNSKNASVGLFYRIVAPMYPAPPKDDDEDTAPRIKVVLINDESLRSIRRIKETDDFCVVRPSEHQAGVFCSDLVLSGGSKEEREELLKSITWPPPLALHAAILEKISELATPKALLIDFGFFDDRKDSGVDKLQEFLCLQATPPIGEIQYREWVETCPGFEEKNAEYARFPIFLSAVMPRGNTPTPVSGLRVLSNLANAATDVVSTRYVAEEPDSYNLYQRFDCEAILLSAASTMSSERIDESSCGGLTKGAPISVFWATWGAEGSPRGSVICKTLSPGVLGRLADIWIGWFWGAAQGLGGLVFGNDPAWNKKRPTLVPSTPLRQICPPHETIPAHELLFDSSGGAAIEFEDAYVLYGGNFTMADDLIRPPAHELLPGVYFQAMALDNLLRQEDRAGKDWLEVLLMLLAIAIVACWHTFQFNSRQAMKDYTPRTEAILTLAGMLSLMILTGVALALLVGLTWLGFFHFKQAPINFVAVLLAPPTQIAFRLMLKLADRLLRQIERVNRLMRKYWGHKYALLGVPMVAKLVHDIVVSWSGMTPRWGTIPWTWVLGASAIFGTGMFLSEVWNGKSDLRNWWRYKRRLVGVKITTPWLEQEKTFSVVATLTAVRKVPNCAVWLHVYEVMEDGNKKIYFLEVFTGETILRGEPKQFTLANVPIHPPTTKESGGAKWMESKEISEGAEYVVGLEIVSGKRSQTHFFYLQTMQEGTGTRGRFFVADETHKAISVSVADAVL